MKTPFICRGDNGRPQPNFSAVLGTFASAEISNLYYPSSSQSKVTASNMVLGLGLDSADSLLLEFVYPHITTSAPKMVSPNAQLVLREGTPVSLILTEDLSVEDARRGKTVAFTLARDIKVDGVVVVRAGSKVSGEVIGAAKPSNDGTAEELPIQFLFLQVGEEQVPLRRSKERVGDDDVYYRLPGNAVVAAAATGKTNVHAGISLTAYVAKDTSLHPVQ
jgi:hypothetical protein